MYHTKSLSDEKIALSNLIVKMGYGSLTNATVIEHTIGEWVMAQQIFIKLSPDNLQSIIEYIRLINQKFISNDMPLRATSVKENIFVFLEEGDKIHEKFFGRGNENYFLCLTVYQCKFDGVTIPERMDDALYTYLSSENEKALALDYNIYNEATLRSVINTNLNQYSLQYVGLFGSEKDVYPKLEGFITGIRTLSIFDDPTYIADSLYTFKGDTEPTESVDE